MARRRHPLDPLLRQAQLQNLKCLERRKEGQVRELKFLKDKFRIWRAVHAEMDRVTLDGVIRMIGKQLDQKYRDLDLIRADIASFNKR